MLNSLCLSGCSGIADDVAVSLMPYPTVGGTSELARLNDWQTDLCALVRSRWQLYPMPLLERLSLYDCPKISAVRTPYAAPRHCIGLDYSDRTLSAQVSCLAVIVAAPKLRRNAVT
jgi:hypothetical protein